MNRRMKRRIKLRQDFVEWYKSWSGMSACYQNDKIIKEVANGVTVQHPCGTVVFTANSFYNDINTDKL